MLLNGNLVSDPLLFLLPLFSFFLSLSYRCNKIKKKSTWNVEWQYIFLVTLCWEFLTRWPVTTYESRSVVVSFPLQSLPPLLSTSSFYPSLVCRSVLFYFFFLEDYIFLLPRTYVFFCHKRSRRFLKYIFLSININVTVFHTSCIFLGTGQYKIAESSSRYRPS